MYQLEHNRAALPAPSSLIHKLVVACGVGLISLRSFVPVYPEVPGSTQPFGWGPYGQYRGFQWISRFIGTFRTYWGVLGSYLVGYLVGGVYWFSYGLTGLVPEVARLFVWLFPFNCPEVSVFSQCLEVV